MITDNHRRIADLAAHTLHLGKERRAKFLKALEKVYPMLSIATPRSNLDIKKLRKARKLRRWSQTKMARKSDLSLRQYQNIENGHSGTTRRRMILLAQSLGISVLEIV